MIKDLRITVAFPVILLLLAQLPPFVTLSAQSSFTCSVGGKEFNGTIKEVSVVQMNKEKLIQMNVVNGDKIIYLYLQESKIKNLPATLKYIEHDDANSVSPESELIWVPDGPDNPQWNSVEGKTIVTQFDSANKTISGTFNFKVEKFEYTSNEDQKRPSMEITDGKFTNITYKEALSQGK